MNGQLFYIIIKQKLPMRKKEQKGISLEQVIGRSKTYKKKYRKQREGCWSIKQQINYIQFLRTNGDLMRTSQNRKKHKIFKQMSNAIGTKSHIQAKSHHQKLQEKYHSTYNIILHVEKNIEKRTRIEYKLPNLDKPEHLVNLISLEKNYQNTKEKDINLNHFDSILGEYSEDYASISLCLSFNQYEALI